MNYIFAISFFVLLPTVSLLAYLAYFKGNTISEETYLNILSPGTWKTAEMVHRELSAQGKLTHQSVEMIDEELQTLTRNSVILSQYDPMDGVSLYQKRSHQHIPPHLFDPTPAMAGAI